MASILPITKDQAMKNIRIYVHKNNLGTTKDQREEITELLFDKWEKDWNSLNQLADDLEQHISNFTDDPILNNQNKDKIDSIKHNIRQKMKYMDSKHQVVQAMFENKLFKLSEMGFWVFVKIRNYKFKPLN
jgi:DNA-binding transcriptional regulator GbsR (MarR family)